MRFTKLEAAQAEAGVLRLLLEKAMVYAEHFPSCPRFMGEGSCDCGLIEFADHVCRVTPSDPGTPG